MEVWQLVLYGVASLLAVRALLSQMTLHKRNYRQNLLAEEEQKRRAERAKAQQAAKPAPAKRTNGAVARQPGAG